MAEQREPNLALQLLSQPQLLAAARAMVSAYAQRLGFNEIQCGQISLAVDEAICNIINHGYDRCEDRPIWLKVWSIDDGMRIVLEDRARQVDPATIRSRDLADIRPGGLGVHLIREVMDDVRYEKREGKGMRLTLIKRLHDDQADQAQPSASHVEGDS